VLRVLLIHPIFTNMLQTQSRITIKDNSGLLRGKIINSGRSLHPVVGNCVKATITRAKSKSNLKGTSAGLKQARSVKGQLQDLLIIQTRKQLQRYDGSSIKFDSNSAVSISFKGAQKKKRLQFGFKRINTAVPFELKKRNHWQSFKGSYNLIKLAKNLL
jgi:large subunit ribosomal protein L14